MKVKRHERTLALRGSSVRPRIGGLFAALFDVVALAELMPMCGEDWGCCWGCGCCCEYWCWGCCAIFVKLIDMFPFGCITAPEVVDMEDEFDGAAALNGVLLAGGGVLLVGGGVLHIGGGPPTEKCLKRRSTNFVQCRVRTLHTKECITICFESQCEDYAGKRGVLEGGGAVDLYKSPSCSWFAS